MVAAARMPRAAPPQRDHVYDAAAVAPSMHDEARRRRVMTTTMPSARTIMPTTMRVAPAADVACRRASDVATTTCAT